jgi:hypothetical protein
MPLTEADAAALARAEEAAKAAEAARQQADAIRAEQQGGGGQ